MRLIINGQSRDFPTLGPGSTLAELIAVLALQGDRVAVEHNGTIVPRAGWHDAALLDADKLEMVHFVGGGVGTSFAQCSCC